MRTTGILQAAAFLIGIVLIAGCSPGRDTRYSQRGAAPRHESYTRLILTPRPGFTMNRHRNGDFYHRGQRGLMYWQGRDNRFYLDRRQVHKVKYRKAEYREWKRLARRNLRR